MAKTVYAGIDRLAYPGDAIMRSLWDHTNLYWTGFYIGPRYDWSPHYRFLKDMRWGIAPIYMGKQMGTASFTAVPRAKKYDDGALDGKAALMYLRQAGVSAPSTVYFDCEANARDAGWVEYFAGWSRVLVNAGFSVGCYCSYQVASWLVGALMQRPGFDIVLPVIWTFNIDKANPQGSVRRDAKGNAIAWAWLRPDYSEQHPSGSGYSAATSWQYAHMFGLEWDDPSMGAAVTKRFGLVDMDTSIFRDPGNPLLNFLET